MEKVTITRSLDKITVKLLSEIAERDAGNLGYPNESATIRRLVHEEAKRIGLEIPTLQSIAIKPRRKVAQTA